MNDANESQLMRAYELIEAGKLDEARAIVSPILAKERSNVDAWWIYAHAVTDPLVAKDALTTVLRLDPEYPGARELNEQLNQQLVSAPEFAPPASSAPQSSDSPDFDELGHADDDKDHDGFNLPRILLIAAVFIIIAVAGLFLASQTGPSSGAATEVASATNTPVTDATSEALAASTEVAGDSVSLLAAALSSFTLRVPDPVTLESTTSGQIAVANVCGAVSAAVLEDTVNAVKLALGQASASLGSDVQALGIRALDCTSNRVILQIGVDMQTATSYASGGLTDLAFSDRWSVIR
ncbi:MAG: hypothetical protein U0670_13335 [Anaerolineae bacterium]